MAETAYDYSVAGDFPGADVNPGQLQGQVVVVLPSVDHVATRGDLCQVWFPDALTPQEEAELDSIVAAHWPDFDGEGDAVLESNGTVVYVGDGEQVHTVRR